MAVLVEFVAVELLTFFVAPEFFAAAVLLAEFALFELFALVLEAEPLFAFFRDFFALASAASAFA